jgi:predicted methyltransferase
MLFPERKRPEEQGHMKMTMQIRAIRQFLENATVNPMILVLNLCMIVPAAMAQEESLKPGVNVKYENPDIQKSTRSLESENRDIFKHRKEIMGLLNLRPGLDVADIGAGTGFFSQMMATEVGPDGTVYAVELSRNFFENLKKIATEESLPNLKPVLCDEQSTKLPAESVDLVFVCDTYHHIEFPYHALGSIHQALRPNGQLLIIDFERIKGISPESRYQHVRCGKGTVTDEVKDAGFDFVEEIPLLKDQWIRRFRKRP